MVDLPTEKQLNFLKKSGYSGAEPRSKSEASDIISKLLGNSRSVAKDKQQTAFEGNSSPTQSVKWQKPTNETLERWQALIDIESEAEAIAYHITKELHPEMSETSQTFGMIVSSKEDKLIQLKIANVLLNKP